ncbi:MAG: hypothetical protein ACFCU2_06915 [Acidimicrobiia bacterium]
MSFQGKSTALMLAILIGVYVWYFVTVARWASDTPVTEIAYQPLMLATVVILVILAVGGHILLAVIPPYNGRQPDERDRLIEARGESIGGLVLGAGAVVGIFMAMAEFDYFWIANTILLGLVLSEVVAGGAKLIYYRRI